MTMHTMILILVYHIHKDTVPLLTAATPLPTELSADDITAQLLRKAAE